MQASGYTPPLSNATIRGESFVRDPEIERLLEALGAGGLGSVQNYKRSVLYRRLRRCLLDANCAPEEFAQKLETDPEARATVQRALQINVTGFFRDPDSWTHLQRFCLSPLVTEATPIPEGDLQKPVIRAWSAGCATGEEAYSLAIAVAELLPDDSALSSHLKLYGTDTDRGALEEARKGVYNPQRTQNVSGERLDRYFQDLGDGRVSVRNPIRDAVIFGGLNLLTKPPIPHLDLIVCRNVLIYFDREGQTRVMDKFRFALRPGGYLFLGPAECIATEPEAFRLISAEHRIFQKEG